MGDWSEVDILTPPSHPSSLHPPYIFLLHVNHNWKFKKKKLSSSGILLFHMFLTNVQVYLLRWSQHSGWQMQHLSVMGPITCDWFATSFNRGRYSQWMSSSIWRLKWLGTCRSNDLSSAPIFGHTRLINRRCDPLNDIPISCEPVCWIISHLHPPMVIYGYLHQAC